MSPVNRKINLAVLQFIINGEIMCTMITQSVKIDGSGKNNNQWFQLQQANISFDHPFHAPYAARCSLLGLRRLRNDRARDRGLPRCGPLGVAEHSPRGDPRHEQDPRRDARLTVRPIHAVDPAKTA